MVTVDVYGRERDRQSASARYRVEDLVTEEGCSPAQIPLHEVTVPLFELGKYLVTQAQWVAVAALPKVDGTRDPMPAALPFAGASMSKGRCYDIGLRVACD